MNALVNQLSTLGQASLNFFWFPILIWTALALFVYLGLKMFRDLNALYQYHLRTALLAALPAGLLSWSLLNWYLAADAIQASSAKIIYVMNPISVTAQQSAPSPGFSFFTPELGIGILFVMLLTFAMYQLIRFIVHFRSLHVYKKSMSLISLRHYPDLSEGNRRLLRLIPAEIQLALCDEPQIPSTFGWRKPVIVVPALLCSNTAKLNLAIRHELIHIRQHDYLVNMGVQLVSRIFRFHPLVGRISREIHEYSEISCDNEVLSDTSIPARHYAYLLFELLQLPVINQSNMVNMAHPNSNIKKRIHAMNISNHKNNSIRISFSLFTLILVSISMIMACSGLQNQDTSGANLVGQKITFYSPVLTINGHTYPHLPDSMASHIAPQKYPALGIIYLKTYDYGAFLISGQSFSGAKPVGTISGNHLKFTINNREVEISTKSKIVPLNKVTLWVKNVPLNNAHKGDWYGMGWTQNLDSFKKMVNTPRNVQPPMPQSPVAVPYQSSSKDFKYLLIHGKKSKVYVVTKKMPRLIGGLAGIQARIQYPELAQRAGIEGRVFVEFIVDKQGNVEDPKVVRGIGGECDKEALKVVKQAKFTPGMKDGKPVNVRYSIPIIFKLPD